MAPFRFEPISAAPYTEKQGAIWGKTVGDLSNVAAQAYEGFAKRASDNEFKTTLMGELKQRYGEDPILSKQIANNEQKIMQMPRTEAEAAIASYAMQAETFKSTKELYPEAKLVAPVGFIPDAQVGYCNMLKGAVDKYSGDKAELKSDLDKFQTEEAKLAEEQKVRDAVAGINPISTDEGAYTRAALKAGAGVDLALKAKGFAKENPERERTTQDRKISSDEKEEKMKRFDALALERADINKQLASIDAVQRKVKQGASIESLLTSGTDEEKASAQMIKDNPRDIEGLRQRRNDLGFILEKANKEGRKKEAFEYEADYAKHTYNWNEARKAYDTEKGKGAFDKLYKENPKEANRLIAQYKQNPTKPLKEENSVAKSTKKKGRFTLMTADSD